MAAFDAATNVEELSGDGVVSLTHTSTGTDLAVFAGVGGAWAGNTHAGVTYNGVAMTEMWDLASNEVNAGYRLAGQAEGAVTVTATGDDAGSRHWLGVISMTAVDQTTPVGTAVTATGVNSPATITVATPGADDLVVDNMTHTGSGAATVGAGQTQRYTVVEGSSKIHGSTQAGSDGGVMSYTITGLNDNWEIGAVAFISSAAAAATWGPLLGLQNNRLMVA